MSHSHPSHVGTYRYGESRRLPGLAVGATRHLPRGVRREDYTRLGYFDVWLPLVAPSRELVGSYLKGKMTFPAFARKYRSEMRDPAPRQAIRLLAAAARQHPVHLGCFCADESRCHRSVLRQLVLAATADLPPLPAGAPEFFSPACSMPEITD